MDGEETGFTDKQKRPIHVGDVVQLGLGISDRVRKRVVSAGGHTMLVNADETDKNHGGYALTAEIAKTTVILDHLHKPFV